MSKRAGPSGPSSEHATNRRRIATMVSTLCIVLILTAACSGGLQVPQVNLGRWANSRITRAARQQVTTRIAAAIAALRAAHLTISADAVGDLCSRWENVQGNGAITEWGVQCTREEDVFGGLSNHQVAQLTVIQRILDRYGWRGWAQLGNDAQCGNYSRGTESQMLGRFASATIPVAADPTNELQADVNVSPISGHLAHDNIDYLLGCVECGPDAIPRTNHLGGIPPFYYVQHTCPPSSAIENAVTGQAGLWHVDFFDTGYVYATASGNSPPSQSSG
jgi:hypothetical protein